MKVIPQIAISVFVASIVLAVTYLINGMEHEWHENLATRELQTEVDLLAGRLEQSISHQLQLTRGLAAFVKSNPTFTEKEFHSFANALTADQQGIVSLQLAPNAVVTYLTNFADNATALGHDLLADPKRRPLVQQAIDNKAYVIAGPINLIQGGRAIIARLPIFFPQAGGDGKFWGFATILVDPSVLIRDAGIIDGLEGVELALRGKDGLGKEGDVFFGSSEVFESSIVEEPITLPSGSWVLGARWSTVPTHPIFNVHLWIWIIGSIVAAISGGLLFVLLRQPNYLKTKIAIATQRAEQANLAKSEFLAHMSHELRTPLNAICGFSEITKNEMFGKHVDPKYKEYAGYIFGAGQHLIAIIDDVLDISKIEAGEVKAYPESINLHDTVSECVTALVSKEINRIGLTIINLSEKTLSIYADPRMAKQILLNLLSNADKFTPDEGQITISSDIDIHGNTIIVVADTGKGMTAEETELALKPFGQIRNGAQTTHKGTGLGLPIASNQMKLHGGRLEIESEPSVGTTVTLVFPPKP